MREALLRGHFVGVCVRRQPEDGVSQRRPAKEEPFAPCLDEGEEVRFAKILAAEEDKFHGLQRVPRFHA